jgi:hypothetical protein
MIHSNVMKNGEVVGWSVSSLPPRPAPPAGSAAAAVAPSLATPTASTPSPTSAPPFCVGHHIAPWATLWSALPRARTLSPPSPSPPLPPLPTPPAVALHGPPRVRVSRLLPRHQVARAAAGRVRRPRLQELLLRRWVRMASPPPAATVPCKRRLPALSRCPSAC